MGVSEYFTMSQGIKRTVNFIKILNFENKEVFSGDEDGIYYSNIVESDTKE